MSFFPEVLSFLDVNFVSDCHEREEDSQAPPELEPINLGGFLYWQPKKEVVGAILKKKLFKGCLLKGNFRVRAIPATGHGGLRTGLWL